jgi:phosphoglycolate phosphatase-like HAD superfamily hydrolase
MRLLLFDIDHTLLRSGGAGFRVIDRLMEQRFRIRHATRGIVPDGKTDGLILREVLRARHVQIDDEDEAVRDLMALYEPMLADEMPSSPAVLLPGVTDLLEALSATEGILLGLLTGNFEGGARVKLARFGLNRFFEFGAFGSDDDDRNRLPAVAVARARSHTGAAIELGRQVTVIGDTPRDVACALVNGCTAVGVATGGSSIDELREAGAHVVFPDLSETDTVVKILTSAA